MLLVTCCNGDGGLYIVDRGVYEKVPGIDEVRGIAHCDKHFYIVEKQARVISKLDRNLRRVRSRLFAERGGGHSVIIDNGTIYAVDSVKSKIFYFDLNLEKKGELEFPFKGIHGHHVNDIFIKDGLMYMTMFDTKPVAVDDGRKAEHFNHLGVVTARTLNDPGIGDVVFDGLTQPHSVRVDGSNIYYCNSRYGMVMKNKEILMRLGAFARGLAHEASWVGLSNSIFHSDQNLFNPRCGIISHTGEFIALPSNEVYAILEIDRAFVRPMENINVIVAQK